MRPILRPIFESETQPFHAQNGASNFCFFDPASIFFARPIFERARVQFFMPEKLTKMKNWTHCRKIGLRPIFLRSLSVSVLTRPIIPKMGSDLGSENAKLDAQIRVGLGASNFVFRVQFWRVQFLGWPCPLSGLGAPILTRSSFSSLVMSPILGLPKAWHTQFLQRVQLIACPISRLRKAIPVRFKTHTNGGKMLLRYIGETAAATASVKCFGPKASSTTFDCPVILEGTCGPQIPIRCNDVPWCEFWGNALNLLCVPCYGTCDRQDLDQAA